MTLNVNQLPMHNHLLAGVGSASTVGLPNGNLLANTANSQNSYGPPTNLLAINPASIGNTGGSQPHSNMQPYLVLNYCIATTGLFPSRN